MNYDPQLKCKRLIKLSHVSHHIYGRVDIKGQEKKNQRSETPEKHCLLFFPFTVCVKAFSGIDSKNDIFLQKKQLESNNNFKDGQSCSKCICFEEMGRKITCASPETENKSKLKQIFKKKADSVHQFCFSGAILSGEYFLQQKKHLRYQMLYRQSSQCITHQLFEASRDMLNTVKYKWHYE